MHSIHNYRSRTSFLASETLVLVAPISSLVLVAVPSIALVVAPSILLVLVVPCGVVIPGVLWVGVVP